MTPIPSASGGINLPLRIFSKTRPSSQTSTPQLNGQTPQFNVLDPAKFRQPLPSFDRAAHARYFGTPSNWDSETAPPVAPSCFTDDYLDPTLSENEYARLIMLWYYTTGIHSDFELLEKFNQILEIVKSSIGWEIALVGLVDADTFTRIAAKNLPLASAPRRESPCSHTVNQPPGVSRFRPLLLFSWNRNSLTFFTDGLYCPGHESGLALSC